MKLRPQHLSTSTAVSMAKRLCRILGENIDLTDKQIGEICRFIASFAPDTNYINGKTEYGEIGISVMLSIALYEFPDFYSRHQLWQRN